MRPWLRRMAWFAGRWALRAAAVAVLADAALAAGFVLYALEALPPLERWHVERLDDEFDAGRDRDLDLDGYRRLEERQAGFNFPGPLKYNIFLTRFFL